MIKIAMIWFISWKYYHAPYLHGLAMLLSLLRSIFTLNAVMENLTGIITCLQKIVWTLVPFV